MKCYRSLDCIHVVNNDQSVMVLWVKDLMLCLVRVYKHLLSGHHRWKLSYLYRRRSTYNFFFFFLGGGEGEGGR